jgi:hypothetical protein
MLSDMARGTRVLAVSFATLALATGCGGDGEAVGASSTTSVSTTTTTVRPTTTTAELGSEANPFPQPVDLTGGWEDITVSPVRMVPKYEETVYFSLGMLEPGEAVAAVTVDATFSDSQATNGRVDDLKFLVTVEGTKGKSYIAGSLESAQDVVVAPAPVQAVLLFKVDSNDKDLRPLVADSHVEVEPTDLGPRTPEDTFVDLAIALDPSESHSGVFRRGQEACEDGRSGDTNRGSAYGPVNNSPAMMLAHYWGVLEPGNTTGQLARLAVEHLCPDVRPVLDALDRGEVPPPPRR